MQPTVLKEPLSPIDLRFALGVMFPLSIGLGLSVSAATGLVVALLLVVGLALVEVLAPRWTSPQARASNHAWFVLCLRSHVLWQALLMGFGLWVALAHHATNLAIGAPALAWLDVIAAAVAVGVVSGGQGISYAHELGHGKTRTDRFLAWTLMSSVLYAHFMVEHYRGHHVRAATADDAATARRGESLWRFLPRTVTQGVASAWALEAAHHRRLSRSLLRSPLVLSTVVQVLGLLTLLAFGGVVAVVFWVVQAITAVYLLESVNYIEHYGLVRQREKGRLEPFGMQHAWNADPVLTNAMIVNLQRHSDHHVHAWKSYATLDALPGPQLPYGYAACLFMAAWPPAWFAAMHPKLDAMAMTRQI
jgi:alkane 1-monooxygenase